MKPSPLPEWEFWACAHATLEQHLEQAALFVAGRIGELAIRGDDAGVAAWKSIAARIVDLQRRPVGHARH